MIEEHTMIEGEIDLRAYMEVLFRWWWLIALAAVLSAGAAFLACVVKTPAYEAAAGVVLLKSKAEITLGSGFRSLTEEDMMFGDDVAGEVLVDRASRRLNTLAGMVPDAALAEQVFAQPELRNIFTREERELPLMGASVRGEVLKLDEQETDTIQIIVSHSDPDKAAAIANAWAGVFESHVNTIYGQADFAPFGDIALQVSRARTEYDVAKEALVTFLTEDDRINELQRQIAEEEVIIERLRSGRQATISAIVDKTVETKERLIAAYLDDEAANRLFAFGKGQDAKRQILGSWIDAEIANRINAINRDRNVRLALFETSVAAQVSSTLRVFEIQRDEQLSQLERAYARRHELENLLIEARLMRDQLTRGGDASARTTALALLAFKSRVFAATSGLPFNELNLDTSSIEALIPEVSATEQKADLDGLVAAMEAELDALQVEIRQKSADLLRGEGYEFLDILSPEQLISTSYATAPVTGTLPAPSTLAEYIEQRYYDLFDLGQTARSAQDVATETPLFAEIQSLYPDLFSQDPWMVLAESMPAETELGRLATQMADDLLNMEGWEEVVSYSVIDRPLSQEIVRRENDLRMLQAKVVRLNQIRSDLQQDHDLAYQAYSTLLSKEQELGIAAASEGIEVRFATHALPPGQSVGTGKMTTTALGLAVGLMLGVGCAYAFDFMDFEADPRSLWARRSAAVQKP